MRTKKPKSKRSPAKTTMIVIRLRDGDGERKKTILSRRVIIPLRYFKNERFFIHRESSDKTKWVISEWSTGCRVACINNVCRHRNARKLIAIVTDVLESIGWDAYYQRKDAILKKLGDCTEYKK